MGRKGGPDRGAAPRAALQAFPPVARRMPRRMRGLSFPVSVMICQRDSTLRGGIPFVAS